MSFRARCSRSSIIVALHAITPFEIRPLARSGRTTVPIHYRSSGTREDDPRLLGSSFTPCFSLAVGVVLLVPPAQLQVTVPGVAVMK